MLLYCRLSPCGRCVANGLAHQCAPPPLRRRGRPPKIVKEDTTARTESTNTTTTTTTTSVGSVWSSPLNNNSPVPESREESLSPSSFRPSQAGSPSPPQPDESVSPGSPIATDQLIKVEHQPTSSWTHATTRSCRSRDFLIRPAHYQFHFTPAPTLPSLQQSRPPLEQLELERFVSEDDWERQALKIALSRNAASM